MSSGRIRPREKYLYLWDDDLRYEVKVVRKMKTGGFRITFPGWSKQFDCTVTEDELLDLNEESAAEARREREVAEERIKQQEQEAKQKAGPVRKGGASPASAARSRSRSTTSKSRSASVASRSPKSSEKPKVGKSAVVTARSASRGRASARSTSRKPPNSRDTLKKAESSPHNSKVAEVTPSQYRRTPRQQPSASRDVYSRQPAAAAQSPYVTRSRSRPRSRTPGPVQSSSARRRAATGPQNVSTVQGTAPAKAVPVPDQQPPVSLQTPVTPARQARGRSRSIAPPSQNSRKRAATGQQEEVSVTPVTPARQARGRSRSIAPPSQNSRKRTATGQREEVAPPSSGQATPSKTPNTMVSSEQVTPSKVRNTTSSVVSTPGSQSENNKNVTVTPSPTVRAEVRRPSKVDKKSPATPVVDVRTGEQRPFVYPRPSQSQYEAKDQDLPLDSSANREQPATGVASLALSSQEVDKSPSTPSVSARQGGSRRFVYPRASDSRAKDTAQDSSANHVASDTGVAPRLEPVSDAQDGNREVTDRSTNEGEGQAGDVVKNLVIDGYDDDVGDDEQDVHDAAVDGNQNQVVEGKEGKDHVPHASSRGSISINGQRDRISTAMEHGGIYRRVPSLATEQSVGNSEEPPATQQPDDRVQVSKKSKEKTDEFSSSDEDEDDDEDTSGTGVCVLDRAMDTNVPQRVDLARNDETGAAVSSASVNSANSVIDHVRGAPEVNKEACPSSDRPTGPRSPRVDGVVSSSSIEPVLVLQEAQEETPAGEAAAQGTSEATEANIPAIVPSSGQIAESRVTDPEAVPKSRPLQTEAPVRAAAPSAAHLPAGIRSHSSMFAVPVARVGITTWDDPSMVFDGGSINVSNAHAPRHSDDVPSSSRILELPPTDASMIRRDVRVARPIPNYAAVQPVAGVDARLLQPASQSPSSGIAASAPSVASAPVGLVTRQEVESGSRIPADGRQFAGSSQPAANNVNVAPSEPVLECFQSIQRSLDGINDRIARLEREHRNPANDLLLIPRLAVLEHQVRAVTTNVKMNTAVLRSELRTPVTEGPPPKRMRYDLNPVHPVDRPQSNETEDNVEDAMQEIGGQAVLDGDDVKYGPQPLVPRDLLEAKARLGIVEDQDVQYLGDAAPQDQDTSVHIKVEVEETEEVEEIQHVENNGEATSSVDTVDSEPVAVELPAVVSDTTDSDEPQQECDGAALSISQGSLVINTDLSVSAERLVEEDEDEDEEMLEDENGFLSENSEPIETAGDQADDDHHDVSATAVGSSSSC